VLREALDVLEPHARSAGFALELEVEQGLAARFDRDALLQVVFNLVDNGLKYARDAGDKRILLVARRDGDRVALLVRDFGPGVPPRHLRHIFEPFWRGERELTRRSKGTGIGLPLVRGLVERMQGGVGGRNLPDGGFEVRVTLPGATA
jgi:signal transduction histidine kinase